MKTGKQHHENPELNDITCKVPRQFYDITHRRQTERIAQQRNLSTQAGICPQPPNVEEDFESAKSRLAEESRLGSSLSASRYKVTALLIKAKRRRHAAGTLIAPVREKEDEGARVHHQCVCHQVSEDDDDDNAGCSLTRFFSLEVRWVLRVWNGSWGFRAR